MGIRKSYIKLCQHNNTEVTYIVKNNRIEVTFEQAVYGGFHTLVLDEFCNIISNDGFNGAEVGYFQRFLSNNISYIKELTDIK